MRIEEIPDHSPVFVDANIVLYAVQHLSPSCRAFLARCEVGLVEAHLSTVVLAEIVHRRMAQEAQALGLAGPNPTRTLARRPDLVRRLTRHAEEVRDLLNGRVRTEPVRSEDFPVALDAQAQFGLLTNDALNLAVLRRLDIGCLATADTAFDGIPELAVYRPTDLGA